MKDTIPLYCQCKQFHAEIQVSSCGPRAICYCVDCQAYAAVLKQENKILNEQGGTEVLAVRPHQIKFIHGAQQLTFMSLSPQGSLRWYTRCCNTPIANMKRNPKTNHISIMHTCYSKSDIEAYYGKQIFHVKVQSGLGNIPNNSPIQLTLSGVCYVFSLFCAWLMGSYQKNPFHKS